jgi:RHS repeat-associated protein
MDSGGNNLNPNATAYNNRFLFTGREYGATYRSIYVSTFSFYEYRARAYNPNLGRFMSEDPKLFDAGDYNLFRYSHNDPIDFTDPMGTEPPVGLLSPRQMSRWKADEEYNGIMAAAQWRNSGAINAGMTGFQEWKASGGLQMAGVESNSTNSWRGGNNHYSIEGYGLEKGWATENAAATTAIDRNLKPHLYGTGDNTEIGGGTFENKNGTWGFSVIHSDRNTFRSSAVIGVPPDRTQSKAWHIHTGQPHTSVNEFSKADKGLRVPIYLGTPNRMIQLFDRSLTPHVQVIRPALLPDY